MSIDQNCDSSCLASSYQEDYESKYLIKILKKLDLKTKIISVFKKDSETLLYQQTLTPDEIFDKYESYLSKVQIKNLFKNLR